MRGNQLALELSREGSIFDEDVLEARTNRKLEKIINEEMGPKKYKGKRRKSCGISALIKQTSKQLNLFDRPKEKPSRSNANWLRKMVADKVTVSGVARILKCSENVVVKSMRNIGVEPYLGEKLVGIKVDPKDIERFRMVEK